MNRNPYTPREIQYLVQYIAKYHPEVKGRLGQKLYQTLVDNPKKWPWGRGHSWQSWREHYKKNQDDIDRKVRLHLKEQARKRAAEANSGQNEDAEDEEPVNRRTVETERKTTKSSLRGPHAQSGPSQPQRTKTVEQIAHERNASKTVHPVKVVTQSREVSNYKPASSQRIPKPVKVEPKESAKEPSVPPISTLADDIDLTEPDEDIMHELFGTSEEEEEEEEDTHETDQLKESVESLRIRAAKPSKITHTQEPVSGTPQREPEFSQEAIPAEKLGIEGIAPVSVQMPVPPSKPKVLRKRILKSPDPYRTGSSSPDPPLDRRPQAILNTRTAPPVRVTEGFRTVLKRPRRSSTGNEDGQTWPPKRAKKFHGEEKPVQADKPQSDEVLSPLVQEVKRRPVQVQVNAVASSSSMKLPVDPLQKTAYSHGSMSARKTATKADLPHDTAYSRGPTVAKKATPKVISPKPNAPAAPRTSSNFAPPEIPVSDDDPFLGKKVTNDKGKARAEFVINPNPPQRIDFQKQLLKRRLTNTSGSVSGDRESRRSSLAPSVSSKQGKQSTARPSLIERDEFLEIARQETIKKLALMASKRGIDFEFAHETYLRMKNLEDTEFILQKVYERDLERRGPPRISFAGRRAPRTSSVIRVDGEPESSDEVPHGLVRHPSPTASHARNNNQQTKQRRKSGRPSLVIRPIPTGDEPYYLSDYSPPNKTRAGQFARLERQGRREEALEREKRRVSGFFVPETQVSLQKDASRSPPPSEGSPSPKGRPSDQSVPKDEDDGMEVDEQAEPVVEELVDEEPVVEEPVVEEPVVEEPVEEEPVVDTQEDLQQREMELDQYINQVDEEEMEDAVVQTRVDQEGALDEQDVADTLSQTGSSNDEEESVGESGEDEEGTDEPEDDEDDMYMSEEASVHEADDESDERSDSDELEPSPVKPTTHMPSKQLLGGRENDPALLAEREEHRRLALNKQKDIKEMQTFEESHDSDLLRLWSMKWMRELKDIGPRSMIGDNAAK